MERQALENRTLRLLNQNYRIDINKFKYNANNSKKHEGLKKRILNWLVKNDFNVVCEACFKTGGRTDLLVLSPPMAIEVLVTETEERFSAKDYPVHTVAVRKIKEVKEMIELVKEPTRDELILTNQILEKELLRYKKGYHIFEEYFDSIPDEEKAEVHEKLEALGL